MQTFMTFFAGALLTAMFFASVFIAVQTYFDMKEYWSNENKKK